MDEKKVKRTAAGKRKQPRAARLWKDIFQLVERCHEERLHAAKKESYRKFTDVSILNSRFGD